MKLVDWSSMYVQLYSFCTAGALAGGGPDGLFSDLPQRLRMSSTDRGTEVDVSPNQFPAALLIVAATVVGPTVFTAVLSAQKPWPRLTAPTGRHLLQFRPLAPNPGAIDGHPCVLTVDLHCLPTVCAHTLS